MYFRVEGLDSSGGIHYSWMEIDATSEKEAFEKLSKFESGPDTIPNRKIKWTVPGDNIKLSSVNIAYKIVDGTCYDSRTSDEVIRAIEYAYKKKLKIKFHYGHSDGRDWHEENDCRGYIGRSTGKYKIPLILASKNSHGGPGILDHCIVRIIVSGKNVKVLYEHPNYKSKKFEVKPEKFQDNFNSYSFAVYADNELMARFKDKTNAEKYVDNVTGKF